MIPFLRRVKRKILARTARLQVARPHIAQAETRQPRIAQAEIKTPKEGFVWDPPGSVDATCPACGEAGSKKRFLEMHSIGIASDKGAVALVRCPACATRFLPNYSPPDYGHDQISDYPTRFYVEQGAGIDQLTMPAFAFARRGGVKRYLEIGCGYGFGIDFARRVLGWDARGIDPSGIAAKGAKDLGVPIDLHYLAKGEPGVPGTHDAIAASEVIEHVTDPVDFLLILKTNLAPGGAMYLTTPNASVLDNRASPMLVAVACPGYHVVIFSKDGLAAAMRRAGLENIQVMATESTLFASATVGGAPLEADTEIDRGVYIDYLRVRKDLHDRGSTLWMGFAYRLYKELVNRAEHDKAEPVFQEIAAGLRDSRGIDLLDPRAIIAEAPQSSQHLNGGRWPFCLTGLLYMRGVQLINTDWAPEPAFPYFMATLDVGHQIRASLLTWGSDDGELNTQIDGAASALAMCLGRLKER